jgi:hypothetical protein
MKPDDKKPKPPKPPEVLKAEQLIADCEACKRLVSAWALREARRLIKEYRKTGQVTPPPPLVISRKRIPTGIVRVKAGKYKYTYDDPSKPGGPHA